MASIRGLLTHKNKAAPTTAVGEWAPTPPPSTDSSTWILTVVAGLGVGAYFLLSKKPNRDLGDSMRETREIRDRGQTALSAEQEEHALRKAQDELRKGIADRWGSRFVAGRDG